MIKKFILICTLACGGIMFSQSNSAITLKEIQKTFKFTKYPIKVLTDFRKMMDYDDAEYLIYELVPGEIISFTVQPFTASSSAKSTRLFKIENGMLKEINYSPQEYNGSVPKDFQNKVEKYAGKNWAFVGNSEFDVKKLKDGVFLISTNIKKEDEGSCCPSLAFEYSTKDFINFTPRRISDDNENWTVIK